MRNLLILCSFVCLSISAVAAEPGAADPAAASSINGKPQKLITFEELKQASKGGTRVDLHSSKLLEQIAHIDSEIENGIIYSELSGSDLEHVQKSLKSFSEFGQTKLNAVSDVAITPQLLQQQKKINSILDRAQKDSVLKCFTERTTGTHLVNMKCRTVAQVRRIREKSQDNFLRRNEGKLDAARSGGGGRATLAVE
ncbi:MAG: hypothetical protein ABI644_12615 [Arenimonas sp.]